MAIWTKQTSGRQFQYDDDKLDFDAWIAETDQRIQAWKNASIEQEQWERSNPAAGPHDCDLSASRIFLEWYTYANAKLVE